jgi:molybdopterin molybdotransferase
MITVNEAKNIVRTHSPVLPAVRLSLGEAAGHVLAEDVYSAIDFPPFNQSNVDGYAISFLNQRENLLIGDTIEAGDREPRTLKLGHAIRIFTGAPIPAKADTVVMQENTRVVEDRLTIHDEQLRAGSNLRPQGTDKKRGDLALNKHEFLSPAAIGFLAALGISTVSVVKKPAIRVIITGNELQQPGQDLLFGQVYEANSFLLKAALQQLHFADLQVLHVDDNLKQLTSTLQSALDSGDVVLLCGGISVGDYDFVLQAATDCGVEKLFHKVKQRPGKPLYFGRMKDKLVFGLPGNPSSVLTCFYEYVVEALAIATNTKSPVTVRQAYLANDFKKSPGLTQFLKGLLENDRVTALTAQESYRLSSYATANCLIRMEENNTEYLKGSVVEVHILPMAM